MSGFSLADSLFRGRSELWRRTVSAVILGAVALGVAFSGGLWLTLFWAAAGGVATHEFLRLTDTAETAPQASRERRRGWRLVCALLVALVALAGWSGWLLTALGLGLVGALVSGFVAGASIRLAALFGVGFLVGAVLALTPPLVRADLALGLPVLLWMFAVVWATDIGAYFTGKSLGGPKLWPAVSPGKTWSGFFGGAVAGVLAGVLVLVTAFDWASVGPVIAVSALASVLGQGGDLAESALKRRAGVKDSGQLIPGHGGVLDRLDAFWAVTVLVAVGYLGWRLVGAA